MSSRKLSIVGISGRMGGEIRALAPDFHFQVTSGVSMREMESADLTVTTSIEKLDPKLAQVVIDFSLPLVTDSVLKWCVQNRIPLVSGVTGISEMQKKAFAEAGKTIPVLWAPNMSLGVAVMSRMLSHFSALEDFEFQVEELHHKRKKDRPSGTALFLQESLRKAAKTPLPEPLAIRGGGIFGIHRVWAMGEEEMITLEHTAMNRRVFARGALNAASWILAQPAGFYRMDDLLS